jgi:4-hydroxy-tetrahydrodipicolinate reductase
MLNDRIYNILEITKMIKLAISGSAGRMGTSIIRAVHNTSDFRIIHCFENYDSKYVGSDAGEIAGVNKIGIKIKESIEIDDYNVIIDFTNPDSSLKIAEFAAKIMKPLVIGTTGFDEKQIEKIKAISQNIPCLISPNMSLGINLLFLLVEKAASILNSDYDCEIVEIHHNKKKDSPSGTAKKFAEIISRFTCKNQEKSIIQGRSGFSSGRPKGEIGIHSVRAGDVIGDHDIIFAGCNEMIEFRHRVESRDAFVQGALKAAKFVSEAPSGLYSMLDLFK